MSTDKELIEPEQKIVNIIPAKYETRTREVLISEESGKLSYIKNGEFVIFKNTSELTQKIKEDLG